MNRERRQTPRLQPKTDIQLIFNCATPVVGRIQDISARGISVEYEGNCQLDLDQDISISILEGLYKFEIIADIQCILVYRISTLAHGRSFLGKDMGLIGMAYKNLSPMHHAELEQLLESLSAGPETSDV